MLRKEYKRDHDMVSIEFLDLAASTPLRMSYEESSAKASPFGKMIPDMLDQEMIEDTAKIVNEAIKDRFHVLTAALAATPPNARKIANKVLSEKQQRCVDLLI